MDIKCTHCGKKVVNVTKRRRFCSQKCADVHRYILKPKRGKWLKCAYCGKKVWTMPHKFKSKHRFCSKDHSVLFQKKHAFRSNCIICGKLFFCQPFQAKYRKRRTCSKMCGFKLMTITAEKKRLENGVTQHQIDRRIRYSKKMDIWRIAVFAKDDYTCQNCGKRGDYIQAHHIKPFAYFPELRFEISNGQTLCRECHNKTKTSFQEMRQKYA